MSSETTAPVETNGAKILLHPLCDRRGMISGLLLTDACEPQVDVENLFFAWLLDLPASVDPGDAAGAIIAATRSARHQRDRASAAMPSTDLTAARQKLYQLLAETCLPKAGRARRQSRTVISRTLKNAQY